MKDQPIFLFPYDSSWPEKFEKEKQLIDETIGEYITGGIHHVGSTAIPGLSAKPIIDILVGVESLEESKPCIEILKKIDYMHAPYKVQYEHWFCKPNPENRRQFCSSGQPVSHFRHTAQRSRCHLSAESPERSGRLFFH